MCDLPRVAAALTSEATAFAAAAAAAATAAVAAVVAPVVHVEEETTACDPNNVPFPASADAATAVRCRLFDDDDDK